MNINKSDLVNGSYFDVSYMSDYEKHKLAESLNDLLPVVALKESIISPDCFKHTNYFVVDHNEILRYMRFETSVMKNRLRTPELDTVITDKNILKMVLELQKQLPEGMMVSINNNDIDIVVKNGSVYSSLSLDTVDNIVNTFSK